MFEDRTVSRSTGGAVVVEVVDPVLHGVVTSGGGGCAGGSEHWVVAVVVGWE